MRANHLLAGGAFIIGPLLAITLILAIASLVDATNKTADKKPLLVLELMAPSAPTQVPVAAKPEPALKPQQVTKKPTAAVKPKKIMAEPMPEPQLPVLKKQVVAEPTPVPQKPVLKTEVAETPTPVAKEVMPTQPMVTAEATEIEKPLPTPVPIFQLTKTPQFLHREQPQFPEPMKIEGKEGLVKLEALIDKEGNVRTVNIIKSAGKYFDQAAKLAILSSSFYPAEISGKSVAVMLRIPVKFELL